MVCPVLLVLDEKRGLSQPCPFIFKGQELSRSEQPRMVSTYPGNIHGVPPPTATVAPRRGNPVNELSREDGRRRIEQEDNLINHRVSWLVGSQSFLFMAFVLLRNNPGFYPGNHSLGELPAAYIAQTSLLAYGIMFAGFLIASCSSLGVFAAFMAISSWRKKVNQAERTLLTSGAGLAHLGGLAAILPGPVLASIWALLFTTEWPNLSKNLNAFYLAAPLVITALVLLCWALHVMTTYCSKRGG